ncbi:hypothetical protein E2L05_15600 [Meridianimarinicoccus aquatilis]|uniref:Uncharacterized protein n=1 Tax=Meridianimarinicoccus aquatilis TaxID=2552766 RepID=A0A4R6AP01_9RHOB|nr:hypothetical protein E2L05_15600 [Fluviibacterium aquatile]
MAKVFRLVCVIGRSNIVGKPIALLLRRGLLVIATLTVARRWPGRSRRCRVGSVR